MPTRRALRSERSLIQTIVALRGTRRRVILYDQQTDSIRKTLEETSRRREAEAYNAEHGHAEDRPEEDRVGTRLGAGLRDSATAEEKTEPGLPHELAR